MILRIPTPVPPRTFQVALHTAIRITSLPGSQEVEFEFDLPRRMARVVKMYRKDQAEKDNQE